MARLLHWRQHAHPSSDLCSKFGKTLVAIQAILLTLIALGLVVGILWVFIGKPLVGKATDVMERADESYELRVERERQTEEERAQAEEELKQMLGDHPHADDK